MFKPDIYQLNSTWMHPSYILLANKTILVLPLEPQQWLFCYLVVPTPRSGGSWGLFHNAGLLSQPALKISMKWTSQMEFIMKDWLVWLHDIHESQYPNLIWQIIQNISSYSTFSPFPAIISTSLSRFVMIAVMLRVMGALVPALILRWDGFIFAKIVVHMFFFFFLFRLNVQNKNFKLGFCGEVMNLL